MVDLYFQIQTLKIEHEKITPPCTFPSFSKRTSLNSCDYLIVLSASFFFFFESLGIDSESLAVSTGSRNTWFEFG